MPAPNQSNQHPDKLARKTLAASGQWVLYLDKYGDIYLNLHLMALTNNNPNITKQFPNWAPNHRWMHHPKRKTKQKT